MLTCDVELTVPLKQGDGKPDNTNFTESPVNPNVPLVAPAMSCQLPPLKRAHEGLPFGQNACLRGGIEEETEGVTLVSTHHSVPQFPLHLYSQCLLKY